ncbi:MAG: conjugal transfer protein TraX [Propionibacteriaceae bacterium]|nr:conjugal transfer protein TraX [Propionibacteriaceae bacterium]
MAETAVRPKGLSNARLKAIGLVCVALSAVDTGFLFRGLPADLNDADLTNLTAAVLLEALSWIALPVYAWLLYSGLTHTASVRHYGLRLLALAVVAEVPYDLVTFGTPWDLSSQNPVFALVVCLVVLWALGLIRERPRGRGLLTVVVVVAGIMWLLYFNIGLRLSYVPTGVILLALCLVFFYLHGKENTMTLVGAAIGALAVAFPAFGFVFIHFRNETTGIRSKKEQYAYYALYPFLLAAVAAAAAVR